ncbi:hypothetical protein EYF80_010928 [Liparis tanakae]|uniref:Uncharacterized protein n=1 Tax=Liparis tanakae TaxID=230148 RepID=A0A4Z2IM03_9TELE|nr:hypothetical protein EYF80_010928 [Liparis tanakae]
MVKLVMSFECLLSTSFISSITTERLLTSLSSLAAISSCCALSSLLSASAAVTLSFSPSSRSECRITVSAHDLRPFRSELMTPRICEAKLMFPITRFMSFSCRSSLDSTSSNFDELMQVLAVLLIESGGVLDLAGQCAELSPQVIQRFSIGTGQGRVIGCQHLEVLDLFLQPLGVRPGLSGRLLQTLIVIFQLLHRLASALHRLLQRAEQIALLGLGGQGLVDPAQRGLVALHETLQRDVAVLHVVACDLKPVQQIPVSGRSEGNVVQLVLECVQIGLEGQGASGTASMPFCFKQGETATPGCSKDNGWARTTRGVLNPHICANITSDHLKGARPALDPDMDMQAAVVLMCAEGLMLGASVESSIREPPHPLAPTTWRLKDNIKPCKQAAERLQVLGQEQKDGCGGVKKLDGSQDGPINELESSQIIPKTYIKAIKASKEQR